LEAKSDGTVPEEFFHDMLDEQFSEEETLRQLGNGHNWGRYAELFDFDAARRRFVLPESLQTDVHAGAPIDSLPESFSHLRSGARLHFSDARRCLERTWPLLLDVCVACIGLACFYAVVRIATSGLDMHSPDVVISLSPRALPRYAFYSIVRMGWRIC